MVLVPKTHGEGKRPLPSPRFKCPKQGPLPSPWLWWQKHTLKARGRCLHGEGKGLLPSPWLWCTKLGTCLRPLTVSTTGSTRKSQLFFSWFNENMNLNHFSEMCQNLLCCGNVLKALAGAVRLWVCGGVRAWGVGVWGCGDVWDVTGCDGM